MENLLEFGKFIGLVASLFAIAVVVGGGIGLFFCWLGDKRADREIRKHDAEVREKMRRQEAAFNSSAP